MAVKKIVIKTCEDCPYTDHAGAFGKIAYVPQCVKVHPCRELPYTKSVAGTGIQANGTNVIPAWCPLENENG